MRTSRGPARNEGTAVVGTMIGFLIFMSLLLLAVQVLVRLYVTSAVTAAAYDAAKNVATAPYAMAEIQTAQSSAVNTLGSFGAEHTVFIWQEVDDQQVVLQVRADPPNFGRLLGLGPIVRTVTVRTERFR